MGKISPIQTRAHRSKLSIGTAMQTLPGGGDSKCTIWIMLVDSDKRNGIQDKIDTAEDVEIYVGQEVVPKQ